VLEKSLVGVASHGFDNAVEQLKVVNFEEIHFLKFVENEVLVTPPEEEEDEHVGNPQARTSL
jgi:hypothetical protein